MRKLILLFTATVFLNIMNVLSQDCNMPGNTCQEAQLAFNLVTDPDYTNIFELCGDFCLDTATPDTTAPAGCDFSQAPTVWVKLKTDDIPPTALITSVVSHGLWEPLWSVYYSGSGSCNDLTPLMNFDNTTSCFSGNTTTAIQSDINIYWIAITADPNGPPIDDPGFTLCAYSRITVLTCIGPENGCEENDPSLSWQANWRENGGDLNGPFCPGEEVTFEVNFFYDAGESQVDWFHGIIPDFGPGWDLVNFDWEGNLPIANDTTATFHEEGTGCEAVVHRTFPHLCTFRDEFGILRMRHIECDDDFTDCVTTGLNANQGVLPNGYFWLTNGSSPTCLNDSCKPRNRWGIGSKTAQVNWTYTIRVREFEDELDCLIDKDLQMSFLAFSDDGAGCWEDSAPCRLDKKQYSPPYELSCIELYVLPEITMDDSQVCDGEQINIPVRTNNGSEDEIEIWFEENEFVTGMNNHLFTGGTGIIDDTLSIVGGGCLPIEVTYYARARNNQICAFAPVSSIIVTVWPKPVMTSLSETVCHRNLPSTLEVKISCEGMENIQCEWTHLASGETGSGFFIPIDDSFNPGMHHFLISLNHEWGCIATDTLALQIVVIDTTVNKTGNTLTCAQSGSTYQWLNCYFGNARIIGETGQSFTPIITGSYSVELTLDNCKDTSSCHIVILTDIIENSFGSELSVYPNPSQGKVKILLPGFFDEIEVSAKNISGVTTSRKTYQHTEQIDFEIEGPPDIYFIHIASPGKFAMVRILKL